MKWLLIFIFSIPLWAQTDFESQSNILKEILFQYSRKEYISTRHEEYEITESYDLDSKPYNSCAFVLINQVKYTHEENYHNDRSITTRYYVNLANLEAAPIIESLEQDCSRVVPLRSKEKKIQTYVSTTYSSGHSQKSMEYYHLVMVKFHASELRKEFATTMLDMIKECRGYL